jgi:hypothetical protein
MSKESCQNNHCCSLPGFETLWALWSDDTIRSTKYFPFWGPRVVGDLSFEAKSIEEKVDLTVEAVGRDGGMSAVVRVGI